MQVILAEFLHVVLMSCHQILKQGNLKRVIRNRFFEWLFQSEDSKISSWISQAYFCAFLSFISIYSFKAVSETCTESLGVDMNFIKKWNIVFLFSSAAHWNRGAASKIAVILWPYYVLLCYHFCCFLCEDVLLDRSPKPLFWEQERPVGELCWVLPGALPQQPSPAPAAWAKQEPYPHVCLRGPDW